MTMRLIDAEAFQKFIEKQDESADYERCRFEKWLEQQPNIEVVPKELYEQILWERNIAMEQLEEHGIGFAAKKKNEVEQNQLFMLIGKVQFIQLKKHLEKSAK